MKDKFKQLKDKLLAKKNRNQEVIANTVEDIYIDEDLGTTANPTTNFKNSKRFSPAGYNDLKEPIDALKEDRKVIISLQSMNDVNYRRSINFLSGYTYALEGQLKEIEPKIFEILI